MPRYRNDSAYGLALISIVLTGLNLCVLLLCWFAIGETPKPDTLGVSMAILQTFLGIVALGGFWLIRGAAIRAAEEAARKVTSEIIPSVTVRAVREYLDAAGVMGLNGGNEASNADLRNSLE